MRGDVHQYQPTRFVAGVLFLAIGIAFLLESFGAWQVQPVDVWPLFLIAFGTAVLLGRVRRSKVEEDRSAQLAVAEERVRIARELHDIVAHGVSLMTIQIAAARRVQQSQPEAAEQSLQAAEETGRQSLAQLQGMLSMLRGADASIGAAGRRPDGYPPEWTWSPGSGQRQMHHGRWPAAPWWANQGSPPAPTQPLRSWSADRSTTATAAGPAGATATNVAPPWNGSTDGVRRDPPPRLADLDGLVTGLRQAGLDIDTTVIGSPPPLSPGHELVIYRIIQEALTNTMRHAPQAHVQLELTFAPDHVVVFVDDDGLGAATGKASGGGHGLMGMYERVAALGGTVQAGPRQPGPGWRVHARIPVMGAMGAIA
jgi:signal transduction histidine kinase